MQQFEFNYDLYGMTAAELIALLPREFDPWRMTGGYNHRGTESTEILCDSVSSVSLWFIHSS